MESDPIYSILRDLALIFLADAALGLINTGSQGIDVNFIVSEPIYFLFFHSIYIKHNKLFALSRHEI